MTAAAPVTDVHVHVQPWEMIRPAVLEAMRRGRDDLDTIRRCFDDPGALLAHLDREGVERAVLINYESPDVMGFSTATNEWVLRYTQGHRERLLPCVGVNPRFEPDVRGRAERLADGGARLFKVHGPHMLVSPNDYLGAFPALRDLYEVAQARGIPVMFHTGTSIFRGARSKHGDPLQLEDVGVDFPDLDVVIAHGGRPFWTEEAFFLLRRFPRFHLDLSGIPPARVLEWFPRLEEIGDRVMFGTDWPSPGVPSVAKNLAGLRALPLARDLVERIVGGNALRLFPRR
ncbi:MAG: amidohydrolase [Planctomycetes bacterium]|nr:amidohydrolase [Planctomycetota bacterium]